MLSQDEQWLLKEKYGGDKSTPVFNVTADEIKNKYSWSDAFFADCERLRAGEPLAYLIGHAPFLDCTIHLDSRPLIPRPETELWVEQAIAHIVAKHASPRSDLGLANGSGNKIECAAPAAPRILDLCAGSGCIGVAIAKGIPEAQVDFADIDIRHLPTIEKNLNANEIDTARCHIWQSDLFANVGDQCSSPRSDLGLGPAGSRHKAGRQDGVVLYDFILTNPPYIDSALDRIESSVKAHEPHHALYGGQDGLEFIKAIIVNAPHFLHPHGQLWIEHEPEQSAAIKSLGTHHNFRVATHRDQYRQERYSILVLQ